MNHIDIIVRRKKGFLIVDSLIRLNVIKLGYSTYQ